MTVSTTTKLMEKIVFFLLLFVYFILVSMTKLEKSAPDNCTQKRIKQRFLRN